LNGAGTSLWVLNGFLRLMAWSGAREVARWQVSDGLAEWEMLVPKGCGGAFGNGGNDRGQSSAEVAIGTGGGEDGVRCADHEVS
jgi:hypothetical protein